jgi:hypothetical protein
MEFFAVPILLFGLLSISWPLMGIARQLARANQLKEKELQAAGIKTD